MGAGSYPAGVGPAGFDPLVTTPPANLTLPGAPLYDPETRTFPFGPNGAARAVHPVDHYVALVCTTPRRSLASAPDEGIDFERIKRTPPASRQAVVTDEVRHALRDGISRGDLELLGAPILEDDETAGLAWAVDYKNLRLPGQPARRFPDGA